jgi:Transport and Golgi organisation 2
MCTLSFVPTDHGYYAAMNRDERLTREVALPPALFRMGETCAAYPNERDGGTWFAVNEHGVTLALLNANHDGLPAEKQRSRGSLIPQVVRFADPADVAAKLDSLSYEGLQPFRLVGIFPSQHEINECRWDGVSLRRTSYTWQPRHWFSSGLSDELAERERGEACRMAWHDPGAGSLPWLRALHRSHSSLPGPFSICVHRQDAGTVSYSEVSLTPAGLTFTYIDGKPCRSGPALTLDVPLATPRLLVGA